MRRFTLLLVLLTLGPATATEPARPNVVVILTDDLGFSDIGCYGSEIETPHLDGLAKGGIRFSQFYNTAKCHSSRVSLLSGQYCIAAGDVGLSHAVTSAEVLRSGGYFTAMTGKWHLSKQPTDFGFDRYFGHLSGACNYFSGDKTFRLNGQPWTVPNENFYTTVANVDFALKFLDEARQSSQPWFLYVAFNAPHAPLHALPEDYAKYQGRYDSGWDQVREARVEKQKQLGLLSATLAPSPRPEHIPAWNTMDPWRQGYEANRMTTLAAMIDRVDQEVGRLVDDLRNNNELDNTLILLVSDNGACPYDRKAPLLDVEPTRADVSLADSTGWAWARNSPFRYYKQNQFEGGIATPAIVHWPAGIKLPPGSIVHQPAHLIDVLPTLAEVTGSPIPLQWNGRELRPVSGVSLKPILDGEQLGSRPPIHFLFSKDRGLRLGDWKLVSFQSEGWELYDLSSDRTELHDLAKSEPQRLEAMVQMWTEMANDVLHAPANVSAPVLDADLPHRHYEWTNFDTHSPSEFSRPARAAGRNAKESLPSAGTRKTSVIRARKNTKLQIVDDELRLQFTGDDPGIAMDLGNRELPPGPYRLTFRLMGGSQGDGEVFYTTEPNKTLPNGQRTTFDVQADGQWQNVSIELPTPQRLYQLRLDVCEGAGEARVSALKLLNAGGEVLIAWPEKQP